MYDASYDIFQLIDMRIYYLVKEQNVIVIFLRDKSLMYLDGEETKQINTVVVAEEDRMKKQSILKKRQLRVTGNVA